MGEFDLIDIFYWIVIVVSVRRFRFNIKAAFLATRFTFWREKCVNDGATAFLYWNCPLVQHFSCFSGHRWGSAIVLPLTHWGRVMHICVSKLTIIDSDNGLSPGRRQAIIWTDAGILLIGSLGTNFSEILINIYTFSIRKMHLKMLLGNGGHFHSASIC